MVLALILSIPTLNHKIPKKFPLALEFLSITEMKVKIAYNTFDTGTGFWEGNTSEKLSICGRSSNGLDQARQVAPEPWSCRRLCAIYDMNFSLYWWRRTVPKTVKCSFCETNSHTFVNSLCHFIFIWVMIMKIWICFSSSQLENSHGPIGCKCKTHKPELVFRTIQFLPCSF